VTTWRRLVSRAYGREAMPALRGSASALDALRRLADDDLCAQELLEESVRRIDRVVPSDGFFVAATDPQTTLCIGPGLIRDLPPDQCKPTWDHEFLVPDDAFAFRHIARGPRAVAGLDDVPGGSPRWSAFAAATGFRDELRAAFSVGDGVYGIGQFDRLGDAPPFTGEERAWLERAAPVVARGLRRALRKGTPAETVGRGPGMLVVDTAGRILSATAEAEAWLDELDPWIGHRGLAHLPLSADTYAAAVRAAAAGRSDAPLPRARLCTRRGTWLVVHASLLVGTDDLAVMIEPAQAGDVAPLIVDAYALTQRELDVTRAIARGLGTGEIAPLLGLSPHTVRDHVKAIFEKVGVGSRGELVAKVFAEHYAPPKLHV